MSQQDAAKQQANTRNNIRVVSIFTAAAIGLVGVLVILYAWQLPPFTRHSQFTDNAYVRGQTTFISPQVNGYITAVNVKDFAIVQPGEVLFQIDDRIYKQRVHQAQATLAMKEVSTGAPPVPGCAWAACGRTGSSWASTPASIPAAPSTMSTATSPAAAARWVA